MLHASLGLFLAGLVIFSFGSNSAVFKVVVSWVGLCTLIYVFFTLRPFFRHESPYHTPLTRPLWLLYSGTLSLPVRTLRWFTAFNCFSEKTWDHFGHLKDDYGRRFSHRIEEAAEESALRSSAQIDSSILLWALQSSDGDHELERFFSSIPDFCGSRVLDDPMAAFKTQNGEKMADALIGLLARTLSSHAVPRSTKQRRIMTCNRAMAKASLPINRRTLGRVLYKDWSGLLNSVEFGLLLRNASYSDEFAKYYSECVVSVIIATVQEHDDRWFELATSQLRMSRTTLENYLAHGDSMLLANCIFISRRTFEAYDKHGWNCDVYSWSKTLESVSRFNVQDTLPELQHEFCDMWNELVRNTGDRRSRNLPIYILKHIRNVYFELHRGTIAFPTAFTDATPNNDSILLFPSSYPSCMIERHHPKSSSIKINDVSVRVGLSVITTSSGDSSLISPKETPPKDAPSGLDNATSVAMTSQTQVTPVNGSQRLSPVLPPTRPRGVIEGDTHPNSFSPDFIPPPSNPLRIRGNRTEPMSNTSNSTPVATARAAYTSSNAGHTSTFSAVMQSVDDLPIVSQQSILMAPPSRAVLRQDDRRLNGPLADSTCNTPFSVREDTIPTYSRLTPTSSMSRSDDSPSPSRMGSLETNISTTVLPQQQQSAQFVAATTPDLSPPQRDNRPYPRGKDGPGRSRTTPTRLPTVAS
jgi:hypothetical protein